jgi:hypothetical protein
LVSVKKPRDVKEQISQLVEAQRAVKKVTSREYMQDADEINEDENSPEEIEL